MLNAQALPEGEAVAHTALAALSQGAWADFVEVVDSASLFAFKERWLPSVLRTVERGGAPDITAEEQAAIGKLARGDSPRVLADLPPSEFLVRFLDSQSLMLPRRSFKVLGSVPKSPDEVYVVYEVTYSKGEFTSERSGLLVVHLRDDVWRLEVSPTLIGIGTAAGYLPHY